MGCSLFSICYICQKMQKVKNGCLNTNVVRRRGDDCNHILQIFIIFLFIKLTLNLILFYGFLFMVFASTALLSTVSLALTKFTCKRAQKGKSHFVFTLARLNVETWEQTNVNQGLSQAIKVEPINCKLHRRRNKIIRNLHNQQRSPTFKRDQDICVLCFFSFKSYQIYM